MSANIGYHADDDIIIRNTSDSNNTLADPVNHRHVSTVRNTQQPNENTSLNVDTYFSDEKIHIPDIEKVRS